MTHSLPFTALALLKAAISVASEEGVVLSTCRVARVASCAWLKSAVSGAWRFETGTEAEEQAPATY